MTNHNARHPNPPPALPGEELVVYGTDWCPDARRSRAVLERDALPYRYVNFDMTSRPPSSSGGCNTGPTHPDPRLARRRAPG